MDDGNKIERRRFIRHPICYPLKFEIVRSGTRGDANTQNLSQGGLLFVSNHSAKEGDIINIELPLQEKVFKVKSKVVHVQENLNSTYNIGVVFLSYADAFKVKLVEQIYLIDEYRSLRSLQLGREVSLTEASEEWIRRYSERFKRLYW